MACHKVRCIHLISRVNGTIAEAKMRTCEATRLLGVVAEVSLTILACIVTDNLHRVLICSHGTVGTKSVELSLIKAFAAHRNFLYLGQGSESYVINDTNREVVLWLWHFKVVEYGDDFGRCRIRRAKTVTTTDNNRLAWIVIKCTLNIKIQGLTFCSRFFRTIKNCNTFYCSRDGFADSFDRERTIQMDRNHTNFLALLNKIVDSLASRLCGRTHQDNDVLCIFCTIIVEQVILTTSNLGNLTQILLYDSWNTIIVLIGSFTMCKESLRILCRTTGYRTLWSKRTITELLNKFRIYKRSNVFHAHLFNLMILMRSTETIEEVDKWNRGF